MSDETTSSDEANGWIDIGDELPPLNRIVLTWSPTNECTFTAALHHTETNTYEWRETGASPGRKMPNKITHWQPCPKAPRR